MDLNPIVLRLGLTCSLLAATAQASNFDAVREQPSLHSRQQAGLGAEIDACVIGALEDQGVPGGALALGLDGEIVMQRQYGTRNLNTGEPVGPDTLFRPGSVQKMMTAAAVLRQFQEDRLDLTDSVQQTIPELGFAGPWSTGAITVEDLLTHTSGIPDMSDPICGESLSQWAANLDAVPLFAPAGSFYNYTNAGYSLAGLVAERASGLPFADLMRQQIWLPAGMTRTFQTPAEAIAYGDFSWGHEPNPDTGEPAAFPPDTFECPWAGPSGDFFTTAADLARFALMLMDGGGNVLRPEIADLLVTPAVPTQEDDEVSYGYGVFSRQINGETAHFHSGGVPGGSSHLIWLPERGLTVSMVANRSADMALAAECVLEAVADVPWPAPPGPTEPRSWRRFQGFYLVQTVDGDVLPMLVWVHRRELKVTGFDPLTSELATYDALPVGKDLFWVDLDGDQEANGLELISFVRSAGPPLGQSTWLRNRLYVGQRLFPLGPRYLGNAEVVLTRVWQALQGAREQMGIGEEQP